MNNNKDQHHDEQQVPGDTKDTRGEGASTKRDKKEPKSQSPADQAQEKQDQQLETGEENPT